jgi:hypothetical protein
MSKTKQDFAIDAANKLLDIASQFKSLRSQIDDFVISSSSESYSTIWSALPTIAYKADGTLGAGDTTPISSNPINQAQVQSILNRTVSSDQLVSGVTLILDFQKFLTNQAVSTALRNQVVDDLAS